MHVELKGSPFAQPGGVSFSSSSTVVLSLGDPIELKLEDRVNESLKSEGVNGGMEALHTRTSLYLDTLSAGNTQVLSTLIPEAKKMEEDGPMVVRGDKEEWHN